MRTLTCAADGREVMLEYPYYKNATETDTVVVTEIETDKNVYTGEPPYDYLTDDPETFDYWRDVCWKMEKVFRVSTKIKKRMNNDARFEAYLNELRDTAGQHTYDMDVFSDVALDYAETVYKSLPR